MSSIFRPSPRHLLRLALSAVIIVGVTVSAVVPVGADVTPLTACTVTTSAAAMGPGEGVYVTISGATPSGGMALWQWQKDGVPFGEAVQSITDGTAPITYADAVFVGATTSVGLAILGINPDETPTGSTLCQMQVTLATESSISWVTPEVLPNATVGAAYHQDLEVSGDPTPTCAIDEASDTVPGLGPTTVAAVTAVTTVTCAALDGTPTTPGTYTFTLRAGNQGGTFADRTFTITVADPTPTPEPTPEAAQAVVVTPTVAG